MTLLMPLTRRVSATLVLALALGVATIDGAAPQGYRVVNVYNWSDYIAPKVLEDFTRETGIKVQYDTFDANETLETKLLAGKSGYDVVVPTAYFLERQIKAGVFQKLDKSRLKNLENAWPDIAKRLAVYDPGNQYAVNYMWGTTGIGFNAKAVRERLGPAGKIDSWDLIFKPENLAKFRDCGIHMLDSADDIIPAALHFLGLDPNSSDQKDLEKASELLARIRPMVRKFHSSEYLNALASGEICLVVGWSGDVKQAQKRAAEAKNGVEIGYSIPKEGAQMFFDNLAIPKDAVHVAEAHAFIDFLLRPEVAAMNSNFIAYANGNLASQKFIDKAVLDDRSVYPDSSTMSRLYTVNARDQKSQRLVNRLWTKVKTGR
ncbi:MAG TPA: polyamine ABC transporter substrate-binding protein [Pseudolabrys sp.]|nr:polyamine ABC transporter substrate-binding protein [Pseudolabrys sp.]